jgi:hypothetical protein
MYVNFGSVIWQTISTVKAGVHNGNTEGMSKERYGGEKKVKKT